MLIKNFSGYGRDGGQVWVQRSSHGQHNLFEEHVHDFIELVYVVHGQGRHRINRECFDVKAGDVFMIMPGEMHAFPDAKEYSLELVNCLFQRETIAAFLPAEPGSLLELPYLKPLYRPGERMPRRLSLNSWESGEVLAQLEDMIQECKQSAEGAAVIVRQQLINMLIRLSRWYRRQEAEASFQPVKPLSVGHEILVRQICSHLEQNYYQKITAADLAKQFTISSRHLNRVFRQETGKSITLALQQIRIERARQMLAETNRSVDAIASAVGFNDTSFFSRLFARLVGCSPGGYRKQVKKRRLV
ncbi:AraC family transcriptional regulator [Paenibacillus puerhi]|uniref:AraC family transcriptional regulator n=1 Tax=Paenibacillus puerhi TaxID=2692622 RepID=UPI00135BE66C|nr:AraC family transcriptional regulator [Paenibacillus puerhi]